MSDHRWAELDRRPELIRWPELDLLLPSSRQGFAAAHRVQVKAAAPWHCSATTCFDIHFVHSLAHPC